MGIGARLFLFHLNCGAFNSLLNAKLPRVQKILVFIIMFNKSKFLEQRS